MLPGGPNEEETQAVLEDRESSRLPVDIPVTLFGRDEDGQAFRENTRTVDISKRGARIITLHNLQTDTHVWIENPGAGKISIAKVIRKGKCVDPQEATVICVKVLELLDPEKIWDVESPPRDWEKGFEPPTPAQRLEYLLARERLARPEVLSHEAIETEVPEAKAAESIPQPLAPTKSETSLPPNQETGEPTASAPLEADLASQSSVSDRVITPEPHVQFPDETETGEPAREASPGIAGESSDSPAFAGSANGPLAPSRSSGGDWRGKLAKTIENNLRTVRKISEAAMDSINASATEALAQLKAGRQKVEAVLAAHTEIHQNRLAEVSAATEELERRSGSLLEGFQRKLEAALNEFQAKGAAQAEELRKTAETLLDRPVNQLREQSESAAPGAEAAIDSIQAAGELARTQLESVRAEMESRYASLAEAQDRRMAQLSSAVDGLEQRAGARLSAFEKSLKDTLGGFQQRGTQEQAELDKAAQELLENSKRKLQGHADATLAGFGEKAREILAMTAAEGRKQVASTQQALELITQAARERFDQRLAQKSKEQAETASHSSEAAVNTIRLTAERAVNRLEAAEQKIEEGFSTWADVFQNRLGELFAGMEGLERHSEALLRDFRRQLERALQEFVERKTAETGNLEEASHDVVERLTRQVEERTDATLEELKEQAEGIVRSVEEESQARLASANRALESATRAAADLYAHRLAKTSSEQNEQARLRADEVVNSIRLTAEDSVARMAAAQEMMEARFAALIESHEKRMAEIVSSIEALEKPFATGLEELRKRLQDSTPVDQQEEPPEIPHEKAAGTN